MFKIIKFPQLSSYSSQSRNWIPPVSNSLQPSGRSALNQSPSPVALEGIYCYPPGPMEHLHVFLLPPALDPCYRFPSLKAPDFHHLMLKQCYRVLTILDYLHGSDKGNI